MALFEVPGSRDTAAPAAGRGEGSTPRAKVWLNIGYTVNDRFVSLPVGIPLDTMQKVAETGQNVDFVHFSKARNELLDYLLQIAQGLEPGGEEPIEGLTLQVRRVGAPLTEEVLGENPYKMRLAPPVVEEPAPKTRTRRSAQS